MNRQVFRRVVLAAGLILLLHAALPAQMPSMRGGVEQCLGGGLDAPIRIDVFSDFQCPACGVLYLDTMRQVLKEYAAANKVCVVYHEFPLAMHPYAREAARWSVAAQRIGRKQWQAVVDVLYSRQAEWSQNGKVEVTVASVLSSEDYMTAKKNLLNPEIDQILAREIALGNERQVQSTPTLFVYAVGREQKVVGGIPYETLKGYFDRIVK